jgi:hypothetical protein
MPHEIHTKYDFCMNFKKRLRAEIRAELCVGKGPKGPKGLKGPVDPCTRNVLIHAKEESYAKLRQEHAKDHKAFSNMGHSFPEDP